MLYLLSIISDVPGGFWTSAPYHRCPLCAACPCRTGGSSSRCLPRSYPPPSSGSRTRCRNWCSVRVSSCTWDVCPSSLKVLHALQICATNLFYNPRKGRGKGGRKRLLRPPQEECLSCGRAATRARTLRVGAGLLELLYE